ncbi:MAG: DNA-binding response regulator [Bacteroidetes bacterium]|nr:MAG: DNA-binding response regulator [Bacteroidota bacterium]MBL1145696.1 DNA-binding response regulator [Bacteroidota bacterium]NOG58490.1 response regulator transcription factor [Bacteroidota bacterium]
MKALILDDEPLPAKYLRELVIQHCKLVSTCIIMNDPVAALEYLKENHCDLIFLDVEMPKMTGLNFLENAEIDEDTAVVFTTAYKTYALEAFKVNAIHYLVKPINLAELLIAVNKVFEYLKAKNILKQSKNDQSYLTVFDGERYRVLAYSNILSLHASGSYTKIVLSNEKDILLTKRLGSIFKELDNEKFIRCHKSHGVNISKIKIINKSESNIQLINGSIVPFSNSNRKVVIEKFQKA